MKRKVLVAIAVVLAVLLLVEVAILLRKGNDDPGGSGGVNASGTTVNPVGSEGEQNSEPVETMDPNELPLIPAQTGKPAETETADKSDTRPAENASSDQQDSQQQTETTEDPDGLDENELPPVPAI